LLENHQIFGYVYENRFIVWSGWSENMLQCIKLTVVFKIALFQTLIYRRYLDQNERICFVVFEKIKQRHLFVPDVYIHAYSKSWTTFLLPNIKLDCNATYGFKLVRLSSDAEYQFISFVRFLILSNQDTEIKGQLQLKTT